MLDSIEQGLLEHKKLTQEIIDNLQNHIYTASVIISEAIKNGNKIYICANGNNTVIAQYIVLTINEKIPFVTALSLSDDICKITSIGNSLGYDRIFEKQIEKIALKGDVVIGISTSGNSKNILRALSIGRNMGCKTIGFSGYDGGAMNEFSDINLVIPSKELNSIDEMSFLIIKTIFDLF